MQDPKSMLYEKHWHVPKLQRPATTSGHSVKQCQQFIDRTVKRIEDLDKSREVESVRLQGSGPFATFATGSHSFNSTFSYGEYFARSGVDVEDIF